MKTFARYSLKLESALHLGRRRASFVAQTFRHAPGHLFPHALAAAVGAERGGKFQHFDQALQEIITRFRFGPAFFMDGENPLTETQVEHRLVYSNHHVTLDGATRSAVDTALFEVEHLSAPPDGKDSKIRLCGGVWFDDEILDKRPLREWLSCIRLGGELKTGYGHVRCDGWQTGATQYPGIGKADAAGLHVDKEARLPGAALDGVKDAPLTPWLGRRYDQELGFGRKLSKSVLVRVDGISEAKSIFLPATDAAGLGCWQRQS